MKKITLLTVIAILMPLLVFGFLGCMKKPDHTPDYGPEVAITDIQKAVMDDVPPDPLNMKLDQYISIDLTQVVDTQSPVTLSQRMDRITAYDATSNPNEITWTFSVDLNELDSSGVWKHSLQPYTLTYEKTSQQSQSQTLSKAEPSQLSAYSLKALATQDASQPSKVTYHNLKREEGFVAVPVLVGKRPDCGGVKSCERGLRYLRISFDRVLWDSEIHGTKTSYTITHSPDIPTYIVGWGDPNGLSFSNQLQFCMQTWVEVTQGEQKQVVPVRQCADIRDFQFGHD